ncbi:hypothetical protein B5M09_012072 [Aphanomyces astaci]|uniref:Uncharacterized protein n=1 Tax=Aphanomyces astaci TaxID=112090 RepID=A0A3R7WLK6_APHAT|nr:hypothetical protein B5M09_012072 [Aphanomyces astaci]
MADERKKRKANEIAEDADDSVEEVEEAEAPAQQVEVVDLTAESDDDGGVAPSEDADEVAHRNADWEAKAALKRERLGQLKKQAAADLVKIAMQTVGAEGVQKLLEQHLAREEAAKKARAAEEVKAKARRAEEAKAIAAAATKAADEAAKEAAEAARKVTSEGVTGTPSGDGGHPNATGVGGKERKASGVGTAVKTEAKVKAELVGPERTGLTRDEVFERELGFHWDRSRIFTPPGWGGVDLEYVRNVTRHLTVVREFDETREDWGYQVAQAAGVELYLRLFASAQSFELRVLWMLLAMECMQLARVSFHRFDEFKGAMRELHERERLERWTRRSDKQPQIRAGARAIAAPQQVMVPMSRAATAGESEEEEKSEAAEEEEPPRDPKDRLPSLHRSDATGEETLNGFEIAAGGVGKYACRTEPRSDSTPTGDRTLKNRREAWVLEMNRIMRREASGRLNRGVVSENRVL